MIKWTTLILCFCLFGFAPIYDRHDSTQKIDDEVKGIVDGTHPRQWRVFENTPTINDLQDGEFVLVSSNGWTAIMGRNNVEIFGVRLSCFTVIR